MTTAQLHSSGDNDPRPEVAMVGLPIIAMLIALPFSKPGGTQEWLGQTLATSFAVAALGLVVLFVLFWIARPEGWTCRQSVAIAETITLWLAAGITVAHTL